MNAKQLTSAPTNFSAIHFNANQLQSQSTSTPTNFKINQLQRQPTSTPTSKLTNFKAKMRSEDTRRLNSHFSTFIIIETLLSDYFDLIF